MTTPIIFLDFDGVLNSHAWWERRRKGVDRSEVGINQIDPAAVGLLNQLIDRTRADVVISSTWRMDGLPSCKAILDQRGFCGRVVGRTPENLVGDRQRGHEIQWYLDHARTKPEHIVILDDDSDMAHLLPWHIKTEFATGLTQANVDAACKVLKRKPPKMQPHQKDIP